MRHTIYLLSILLLCTSCIYSYDADIEGTGDQMVIEGSILSGASSVFTLSLSKPISDLDALTQSVMAKSVVVESENGTTYEGVFSSQKNSKYVNGTKFIYTVPTENIQTAHRCRVVVTSLDETVYTSAWVPFVSTPDIDSVFYQVNEDQSGMTVMVDTHADSDASRYYGWTFNEDWEFTSYLRASCYYNTSTNEIINFQNAENIYYCWNHNDAPDINYFSTDKLSDNIVSRRVITRLEANTLKVQYIYSIEVSQRCVTAEEYNYWTILKKDSEETGDLFSSQPNELRGNITSSNPSKIAIGYIGAGQVKKKRIFVDCQKLPLYHVRMIYEVESFPETSWNRMYKKGWSPYYYDYLEQAYYWTDRECVDCRIHGTKDKPAFWPNDDK